MSIGLCLDPTEFLCPNYTEANQENDTNVIKGIIAWESIGSIVMTNATLGKSTLLTTGLLQVGVTHAASCAPWCLSVSEVLQLPLLS